MVASAYDQNPFDQSAIMQADSRCRPHGQTPVANSPHKKDLFVAQPSTNNDFGYRAALIWEIDAGLERFFSRTNLRSILRNTPACTFIHNQKNQELTAA